MKSSALVCILTLAATARAGEFEALIAKRDDLVATLARKPPAEEFLLRIPEGCDTDDMLVTLRRAAGQWRTAYVEVPGLQQSTMNEWRSFYNNTGGGCWRNNLRFQANADALKLSAGQLAGTIDVAYKIDLLMRQRQPPGQRVQWWDKFIPGGYTVPRNQSYTIEADVKPDACMLDLVLEGGVYWDPKFAGPPKAGKDPGPVQRRPILIRMQVPSTRFTTARVRTPSWVPGFHEAAVEGLKFGNGKLTGTLVVFLHQDGWGPWGGGGKHTQHEGLPVTFQLNADLRNNHLTGTYTASLGGVLEGKHYGGHTGDRADTITLPDTKYDGTISGIGGKLVSGRFVSRGDLEERIGAVDGMLLDNPVPLREKVKLADNTPSTANMNSVLHQIRALHLALQHYPLSYDSAFAQTDMPAPQIADASAYLKQAPPVPPTDTKLAAPVPETEGDSPSLGVAALPVDPQSIPADSNVVKEAVSILPDDATGWSFVSQWNILGPFDQRVGLENNDGLIPDLVVMTGASYSQPMDGLGAVRDSIPSIKWQRVSCSGMRLGVPWENAPFYVRFAGRLWYGAATIRSAKARTVWLSLEANDFAKLWMNDQLVWVDAEKAWRYRPNGRAFLPVKLQAGDNRLLARVHNDRKMAWLRMALTTSEPATPPLPAKTQAYANPNIFPDANPPLAWNIEMGVNVAWRSTVLGGWSRPALAGDVLLVSDTNGSLRCLSVADGKERWSAQPGKDPASDPITDGKLVWFHCGALACYDLTGKQAWTRETGLARARAYVSGDLLVVEGQTAVTTRGAVGTLRVITFDAGSGQERKRWDLPGRFDNRGVLLTSGGAAVFLTSEGSLLDVANGRELPAPDMEMQCSSKDGRPVSNITQWVYVFSRSADMFFLTSQERHQAVRFWAKDGKLAFAHAWESNYGHSGFGNAFAPALATDKFLFTTHSVLAHTPHCPDPRAEINVQDVRTGRVLARLKPAMDDLYSYGPLNLKTPTIAGKYLFLLGGRANNTRNQITVATADDRLQLMSNNDVDPGTSVTPVFAGERMILRSPSALTCIAVTTDQGRKYQAQILAKALLRYIGQAPQTAKPQVISGLDRISTAGDIPVGILRDQRTTEFWLGAGPLSAEEMASLRLPDTNGIAFSPLDRNHAYNEPTMYLRTSELQGTGDITPHFKSAMDPRGNAGANGAGVFYTVLENSRDRVVVPAMNAAGVTQWLSGQELKEGQPLYLKAGLYPYLVKVSPEYFKVERKLELPGVLITNALAAGALKDIGWPKSWKVFGPFPADAPPLAPDQLRAIPKVLTVGEVDYAPNDFPVEGDAVNVIALSDTAPGRKPDLANAPKELKTTSQFTAYLFAEVECPADGYVYINAGADWYMQWFIDGVSLHDEVKEGVTGKTTSHVLAAKVSKGRHVLAVLLRPGLRGWQLSCLGGFSEKSADLMPEFRVAPPPKPPRDMRLNPAFREIPHPPTLERMWRDRVTQNQEGLQAIVRDLPGSDEAGLAADILARVK